MTLSFRRLNILDTSFDKDLNRLLAWEEGVNDDVLRAVKDILRDVRRNGDESLIRYTNKFDARNVLSGKELVVSKADIQDALDRVSSDQRQALEAAAERIRAYHEYQVQPSWSYKDEYGNVLGQKITPLDRVGLYAPGGKAFYPSSVLMAAIPAKVAGVQEVVLVTPTPNGQISDIVLAAAAVAGVDTLYTIGGAQAIAALAYGTETVPKVDKIVGPGNIYVATAKREVFGVVDIDMIAGPSEILVVCDGKTPADWVAMDLFSQAEHDEQAQSILISQDEEFLKCVEESIQELIKGMSRKEIISRSLSDRGALIKVDTLEQAYDLVNRIAPEHVELSVEDTDAALAAVRHAGAIFLGRHTSESLGDYSAGPNHVLPTSGTARFSSPLGVYDYVKRSSVIHCTEDGAEAIGRIASVLARGENLEAHARSAELRFEKN